MLGQVINHNTHSKLKSLQNCFFFGLVGSVVRKCEEKVAKLEKKKRLDSKIESKSSNNIYLNIAEIFNKLYLQINIIESQNLVL